MWLESSPRMLECREAHEVEACNCWHQWLEILPFHGDLPAMLELLEVKLGMLVMPRYSPICTLLSSLTLYCFRSVYGEAQLFGKGKLALRARRCTRHRIHTCPLGRAYTSFIFYSDTWFIIVFAVDYLKTDFVISTLSRCMTFFVSICWWFFRWGHLHICSWRADTIILSDKLSLCTCVCCLAGCIFAMQCLLNLAGNFWFDNMRQVKTWQTYHHVFPCIILQGNAQLCQVM